MKYLIGIILLACCNVVLGQFPINVLDKSSGLRDNQFNHFTYKDSKGFLWISSSNALNRYDGQEIVQYEEGIKGNWIQGQIVEDKNGNIWTSTYEYIIKYDRQKEKLESFKLSADSIFSAYYHVIGLDSLNNDLYVSADFKILKIKNCEIDSIEILPLKTKGRRFDFEITKENILRIIAMPWTESTGFEIHTKFLDDEWKTEIIDSSSQIICYDVVSIDSSLFVTSNSGFLKYDLGLDTIKKSTLLSNFCKNVERFDEEHVIISNDSEIILFNIVSNKNITKLSKEDGIIGLSPDAMKSIDSHVFLSFNGRGVQIINKSHLSKSFRADNILVKNQIKSLHKGKGRFLVVNEQENLIVDFNNKVTLLPEKKLDKIVENSDRVIFGFNVSEVVYFDSLKFKWYTIDKLSKGQYNSINVDSNENPYISGSSGSFRIVQDGKSWTLDKIVFPVGELYNINHEELGIFDNNKNLLVKDGTSILLCDTINCQEYISETYIHSLCKRNTIDGFFVCTNDGAYSISSNGKINQMFDQHRLNIGNIFYQILEDELSYFILTNRGLYKASKVFDNLFRFNFKPINNSNSSILSDLEFDDEGNLVIGGTSGLFLFNPNYKSLHESKPKLIINEFSVNNKQINNPEFLFNNKLLPLNYLENNISVSATLIDFEDSENVEIIYSLISDYNITTKKVENKSTIDYNSLAPGKYTLEVQGINSNASASTMFELDFNISNPFYQTWWFLTLTAASLFGIGWLVNYGSTQRKLKVKQRELDRQKELAAQRERIADDLHDELGTELNRILYLSDEAIHSKNDEKKEDILNNITTLAGASIKNMRDMLWVLDDRNDNLQSLVSRINLSIKQTLRDFNIKFESILQSDLPEVSILGETRKNILLILKEATNNIVKHSKATEVILNTNYNASQIEFILMDNGVGISEHQDQLGYGLESMQKRTKSLNGKLKITSLKEGGVKLDLKVPLGLPS